jgi:signal peptidase I
MSKYSPAIDSLLKEDSGCKRVSFEVQSVSMFPSLRPGDAVVTKRTPIEEVRCGDIVVVGESEHYVVHRVIRRLRRKEETGILTKGDISLFVDNPALKEHLIGKVIRIVRNGRVIDPDRFTRRAAQIFFTSLGFVQTVLQSLFRPLDLRVSRLQRICATEEEHTGVLPRQIVS